MSFRPLTGSNHDRNETGRVDVLKHAFGQCGARARNAHFQALARRIAFSVMSVKAMDMPAATGSTASLGISDARCLDAESARAVS